MNRASQAYERPVVRVQIKLGYSSVQYQSQLSGSDKGHSGTTILRDKR